ncbi:DUF1330 domain-containing protein [Oceanicoccus sagamiensis]|uniref:DUF1330 domain-containing protein n=1 Tax=Oceanicoccus sagamiensis TaxID=716816 RepID=A0A1X9NI59_9GAMM|nr:DUF1330 domain-containing protein [Oceanicoccus sagamiensis]ARN73673.1 hypothetical protein BST96_05800 [Oceanicoccus sagamiensis]
MSDTAKPIYVVVSGRILQPEKIAPYAEASGPLAQAAGLEFLGHSKPILLEGEWPYTDGMVTIERFSSKAALENFWHSDAYQEAKKLREGVVDIDFIVAVEEPEGDIV